MIAAFADRTPNVNLGSEREDKEAQTADNKEIKAGPAPLTMNVQAERIGAKNSQGSEMIRQLRGIPGQLGWISKAIELLEQASEAELLDAIKQADEIPRSDLRSMFCLLAFERWGELDGPAALAYVEALPREGSSRRDWMKSVFEGWIGRDPVGAIQYALNNGMGLMTIDFSTEEKLIQRVFASFGAYDFEMANAFAAELARMPQYREESDCALAGLAEWQFQQGGMDTLMKWRDQLPLV